MQTMQVTSAKWTDNSKTHILAEIDGVKVTVVDADSENAHRRAIAEWQAAGNVIADPDVTAAEDQSAEHGEAGEAADEDADPNKTV